MYLLLCQVSHNHILFCYLNSCLLIPFICRLKLKSQILISSREQASGHRVNLEDPLQSSPNEKMVWVPSDKQLAQSQHITNVTVLFPTRNKHPRLGHLLIFRMPMEALKRKRINLGPKRTMQT
jgi:hypothetical protein